ncbi:MULTISPECIES: PAS domain-containing protein [unclassified Rhizobium]|uniref:PAS domain-containing protein n=1 Tax=unclassified Rhizobium TaxID=2613769 RepID=UPI001FDF92FD|nr:MULTISPECIES: PAS domain-containing protein [unclassified Rhizobium]
MLRIWSHHPQFLHLGLFIAAYILGCGFAQLLAIVPGTGISIWPPSGLFIATLLLSSRSSWPWWILGGCLAELFSNFLWFHSPFPAAFLIYIGNALEAVVGAWLVSRILRQSIRLETLREVLAFVLLGAGIAPVVSATVGSATLAWFGILSQTFEAAWPLWWIGDATGVLIVAPLALVVFQNWRGKAQLSAARWIEACALGLILLGVAALSLSGYLPFAYIIMPPLLWAAVRFEFKGAAVTLALLALITAVFTLSGASQFTGNPESQRHQQIMLQLFLAISAFSALIVAAISRQYQLAVLTLHQSLEALRDRERELSQLVDMVPSHVWRLRPDGEPTFFNKRMVDFLGLDVSNADKSGMSRLEAVIGTVIHPDDAFELKNTLRRSLVTGEAFAMRYRLRRNDGVYRWMSSRAEPMRDQTGSITQWYGIGHDVEDQMQAEEAVRRSERQLQQLIDAVPAMIWTVTNEGKPDYVNKQFTDIVGATLADMRAPDGIASLNLIHPEDKQRAAQALADSLITRQPYSLRLRQLRHDGVYRWVEARVAPLQDESGAILRWYGVNVDVDDEVRAQEALRERERELSLLVDMVPVHIGRMSPNGEPTFFSKRTLQSIGLDHVAAWDKPDMSRLVALIGATVHPEDGLRMREVLDRALASGEPYTIRYRRRRADGVYRWMEGRAEPLRDEKGVIVQWYAAALDIDDEVRAQRALEEHERELQQLIDAVPALIWATTPQGTPIYINKRFRDVTGATLEDITAPDGSPSLSVIHPDDRDVARQDISNSFRTGAPYVQRYRQLRTDGSYRWTETRAEPLRDDTGAIVHWYGVSVDIHDLVTAQEALRQGERRYRDLFHYMPIGLTQVDASKLIPLFKELREQGVTELKTYLDEHPEFLPRALEALEIEEVNQHIITMFGAKNAEEMLGSISRYWQPSMATIRRSIEARYRGEEVFQEETKVARMDGSVIDVLFTTARPGAVADKSLVGFIDITERKKAEMALRNREREFSQLVDMVPSLLWRLNPAGEPLFFSKRMIEFIGLDVGDYDGAEISGLAAAIAALVHPHDAIRLADALNHSFATGETFSLNYRLRRADGVYRWMSGRAEPMRDESGRIVQWYGLSHDIDDQLRIEEEVRERERSLWQLVETLPVMIDCAAPDGEPVYRNPQLRDFLGYKLEDLDGTGKSRLAGTLDAGVHPDEVAGVKENYAHSLATGQPYARRHRLRQFDGEYRWVETRAAPMRNAGGAIVQWNVICLDIDGEVRAEEKLRLAQESLARASQAASLSELSASIAHEVNQPLAAVVANSHACQRWLMAEPPNIERAEKTVERIIRDANSAADVVSRIRALFKQSVDARVYTALASVINEARSLVAVEASRRHVRMDVKIDGDFPLVAIDRVQIQQVLINLIRNGMEAMDSITGDRVLGIHLRYMGDVIQTDISDLGQGIEFPERIFEPFFTTKEDGMGMGLAICRSIVESHGGRLWAENNQPHGARFTFTLPVEMKAVP